MRNSPATDVPGVNVGALAHYLPAVLPDYDPDRKLTARLLAGGRSNLTCLLSHGLCSTGRCRPSAIR
jgi:hypothetical protein